MRENKRTRRTAQKSGPHARSTTCSVEAPCRAKAAKEKVDGLLLCERHALEAKLEGQIECWGGMLFHIDLWSREASRREREDS